MHAQDSRGDDFRRPTDTFSDAQGRGMIGRPATNIIWFEAHGHIVAEGARVLLAALAKQTSLGGAAKIHWFCDMEQLSGYHSSLRIDGQKLVRANWDRLDTINILVRSKIVQMGVAVANLALENRLRAFESRAKFESELAGVLGNAL